MRLGSIILLLVAGFPEFGLTQEIASNIADDHSAIVEVFAKNCIGCHSGQTPAGDMDLSRPDKVIAAEKHEDDPTEGLLWQRVRDDEMPPEQKLSRSEKQTIENWIKKGAPWNGEPIDPLRLTSKTRAGRDWWSLQPLTDPSIPKIERTNRIRNPIDAFVLEKLGQQNFGFAEEANPRDLVRRLYFDLIGLPPPAEVVEAFAKDSSDSAYEQLVNHLLAMPEYGERWGRHWLDIVRFGESDGFERNAPRQHLWHYRDWVINALNSDMPYDQFARMQLAGDVISGDSVEGMAATGFLTAGVHNTVVGSSRQMQLLARQDEMEDLVGAVGQTFVGLTFNCARCHDHKFDPIRQEEYYQLVATLAGVNHGVRQSRNFVNQEKIEKLNERIAAIGNEVELIDKPHRDAIREKQNLATDQAEDTPHPISSWDFRHGLNDSQSNLKADAFGNAALANQSLVVDGDGDYAATPPLPFGVGEKTLEVWAILENLDQKGGAAISVESLDGAFFDAIVFAEQEPLKWMAGSNSFLRTKTFNGPAETASKTEVVHFAISYKYDGTITAYRNGRPYGDAYQQGSLQKFEAGKFRLLFGLRHSPPSAGRFLKGQIIRGNLYDRALSSEEILRSAVSLGDFVEEAKIVERLSHEERIHREKLVEEKKLAMADLKKMEQESFVSIYTNVASVPQATFFLPRGDVMNPGTEVTPGITLAIESINSMFELSTASSDSERRQKLAGWITAPENPLFCRVMVNRVWHYHFGKGIVETPSDFGFNGGQPSHPELLDWLCQEFVRNGYHLKPLHKLIVMSSTYRQCSAVNSQAKAVDSDNRLLWRRSPTRLDAETIRDAMLQVSGKLNTQRGGQGYVDVEIIDQNNGTTYYSPIDRDDPQFNRRTIYRFNPRGGRSALLDSFDCPDPSAAAPRRSVTTTALQALSLFNNAFVLRIADDFAKRAENEHPSEVKAQIDWMFLSALGRKPEFEETSRALPLVKAHGLGALARALFNSNEFVVAQ